jgi:hypothetical protein
VKFLRQFAAVVAVVAVVVLLGLAWNRFAPSLPGEGPGGEAVPVQGNVVKAAPHAVKLSPAICSSQRTWPCCGTPPNSRPQSPPPW